MMGQHDEQKELFSYQVDLDKRVREDNPLRAIAEKIDFTFVRAEVQRFYGKKGHVSVDPVIILKMMFLLFFDDVASERELMGIIKERLDYLWFLGYGLNDQIPNHSVLSKARRRWGKDVFESFFVRTIMQCVQAGLVDGTKIHVDSSLVDANASKDSVIKSCPELIAALKTAYGAQESKLEDTSTPEGYEAVNDRMLSTTDPDAPVVRKSGDSARPRYHHHRVVDDAYAVITAVETTPGTIAENKKLMDLVEQHGQNTQQAAQVVVADHKYGTSENYVACQQRGIQTHLGDLLRKQNHDHHRAGIFPDSAFQYRAEDNTYLCPANQVMKARRVHPQKRTWEYHLPKGVCAQCSLRPQCTRSKTGRTIQRHEHQPLLDLARSQAHSAAARRSRKRRQIILEQSFGDATNNHGFKRSRWRRLWRQQIQDWLIAGIQNTRILLSRMGRKPARAAAALPLPVLERPLPAALLKGPMRCTIFAPTPARACWRHSCLYFISM
jgi:transposase